MEITELESAADPKLFAASSLRQPACGALQTLICHGSVGIVEFYTHLVIAVGLESCYRQAPMFRDLKDHVLSMNALSMLESLANSITVTISFEGLAKEETFTYIESRLSSFGVTTPLLIKPAMELIHQAAGGILRTIRTIANAGMSITPDRHSPSRTPGIYTPDLETRHTAALVNCFASFQDRLSLFSIGHRYRFVR